MRMKERAYNDIVKIFEILVVMAAVAITDALRCDDACVRVGACGSNDDGNNSRPTDVCESSNRRCRSSVNEERQML